MDPSGLFRFLSLISFLPCCTVVILCSQFCQYIKLCFWFWTSFLEFLLVGILSDPSVWRLPPFFQQAIYLEVFRSQLRCHFPWFAFPVSFRIWVRCCTVCLQSTLYFSFSCMHHSVLHLFISQNPFISSLRSRTIVFSTPCIFSIDISCTQYGVWIIHSIVILKYMVEKAQSMGP